MTLWYLYYFLCLLNYPSTKAFMKTTELVAVTTFDELEELYLQTRSRRITDLQSRQSINHRLKKNICEHIFRSSYFEMNKETVVDAEPDTMRFQLMQSFPRTFENIYRNTQQSRRCYCERKKKKYRTKKKKARSHRICAHCRDHLNTYMYQNSEKMHQVSIYDDVMMEFGFSCVVSTRIPQVLKEYIISREYNVNKASIISPDAQYIAGRFVFSFNTDDQHQLELHALAEEASVFERTGNIERFYLSRRMYHEPEERAKDDPVCKLAHGEKLRLCAVVLNSSPYRERFRFVPRMHNVGRRCEKREISFVTSSAQFYTASRYFEEWMFSCRFESEDKYYHYTHYISRGYEINSVFVYKESLEKIILQHSNSNVSVLSECSLCSSGHLGHLA